MAVRLNTLAAMISGIVGSESTNLPAVAGKVPGAATGHDAKRESRVKRFERWLRNDEVDSEIFYLPFAEALLSSLRQLPLVFAIDGSVIGRRCMTLMAGVVYKQRALPVVWITAKRKKGHFPETMHIELMTKLRQLIPDGASITVLGGGEFDGVDLQRLLSEYGWKYVLRTSRTATLTWRGEEFNFDAMRGHAVPGEVFDIPGVFFTQQEYGPILALTWWRRDCKEPIHLVSNMTSVEDAWASYGKRFKIETFFSDQKSRGFFIHKSHISNPMRLSRLLIAACLAYLWIVYLGAYAVREGLDKVVHRVGRCDLSLFQLGKRLLEHFLNEDLPVLVAFTP